MTKYVWWRVAWIILATGLGIYFLTDWYFTDDWLSFAFGIFNLGLAGFHYYRGYWKQEEPLDNWRNKYG